LPLASPSWTIEVTFWWWNRKVARKRRGVVRANLREILTTLSICLGMRHGVKIIYCTNWSHLSSREL